MTINQGTDSLLVCLDNMGQVGIYSLPTLRRQILLKCIKASDINALTSIQFSPLAHIFYLRSSSEFTEMTFLAQNKVFSSMAIIYDKVQRQTIKRLDDGKEKLSTLSSPPNSILVNGTQRSFFSCTDFVPQSEESHHIVKNEDTAAISTCSDSAIDSTLDVTSMNDTSPPR